MRLYSRVAVLVVLLVTCVLLGLGCLQRYQYGQRPGEGASATVKIPLNPCWGEAIIGKAHMTPVSIQVDGTYVCYDYAHVTTGIPTCRSMVASLRKIGGKWFVVWVGPGEHVVDVQWRRGASFRYKEYVIHAEPRAVYECVGCENGRALGCVAVTAHPLKAIERSEKQSEAGGNPKKEMLMYMLQQFKDCFSK